MMAATRYALQRLFRRAPSSRVGAAVRAAMLFEPIEPRILHSADLSPVVMADVASDQYQMRPVEPIPPATPEVTSTQEERRLEIVVVDKSVADYERLVADIEAQSDESRTLQVVLVESG